MVILGICNMFGEGISMAFGDFLSSRAEMQFEKSEREREEWEVKNIPELEK